MLLALATVATAWSGYQATRWNGEQAKAASRASAIRIEAARAQGLAEAQTAGRRRDLHPVGRRVRAGRDRAGGLLLRPLPRGVQARRERVDRHEAAADAGRPADAVRDAGVPTRRSRRGRPSWTREAEESAATVLRNIQNASNYVLGVVLFAVALFFAGMSREAQHSAAAPHPARLRRRRVPRRRSCGPRRSPSASRSDAPARLTLRGSARRTPAPSASSSAARPRGRRPGRPGTRATRRRPGMPPTARTWSTARGCASRPDRATAPATSRRSKPSGEDFSLRTKIGPRIERSSSAIPSGACSAKKARCSFENSLRSGRSPATASRTVRRLGAPLIRARAHEASGDRVDLDAEARRAAERRGSSEGTTGRSFTTVSSPFFCDRRARTTRPVLVERQVRRVEEEHLADLRLQRIDPERPHGRALRARRAPSASARRCRRPSRARRVARARSSESVVRGGGG